MSAATTAAVVGAGATAYSAYQQAQQGGGGRSRAEFNPNDVQGLLGGTTFDNQGNATVTGSDQLNQAVGGLFGSGGQMLQQGTEQATKDFGDLRDEELSILRELSEPQEEREAASTASRLFNQGSLGATGGALQMQGLEEAQAQEDLKRQQMAINLAQQQQQQGLQMAQAGKGLLGQGAALGQAPLETAKIGSGLGSQGLQASTANARLDQNRSLADRQFYSNLIGSGAQLAGSAMMGDGSQNSLSSGGLFNTAPGSQQSAMLAQQQQGFGNFGGY